MRGSLGPRRRLLGELQVNQTVVGAQRVLRCAAVRVAPDHQYEEAAHWWSELLWQHRGAEREIKMSKRLKTQRTEREKRVFSHFTATGTGLGFFSCTDVDVIRSIYVKT